MPHYRNIEVICVHRVVGVELFGSLFLLERKEKHNLWDFSSSWCIEIDWINAPPERRHQTCKKSVRWSWVHLTKMLFFTFIFLCLKNFTFYCNLINFEFLLKMHFFCTTLTIFWIKWQKVALFVIFSDQIDDFLHFVQKIS